MASICTASRSYICTHKRNAGKGLTVCAIKADKEKCCFAQTQAEMKKTIDDIPEV